MTQDPKIVRAIGKSSLTINWRERDIFNYFSSASTYAYKEIELKEKEAAYMLSFQHKNRPGCGEVRVNVWITTGTVSTSLDHPKAGKTQLFRKNGPDYDLLDRIFENPRVHSDKGYKEKEEHCYSPFVKWN